MFSCYSHSYIIITFNFGVPWVRGNCMTWFTAVQHLPYNLVMLLWDKQFLHFLAHCGKMANLCLLQVEEVISCLLDSEM
jgi:hypothetical protein